jgi:hypothetical protein
MLLRVVIETTTRQLASGQWQFAGNPIDGAGEVFCSPLARPQRQISVVPKTSFVYRRC